MLVWYPIFYFTSATRKFVIIHSVCLYTENILLLKQNDSHWEYKVEIGEFWKK